jgi:hypothetical protein
LWWRRMVGKETAERSAVVGDNGGDPLDHECLDGVAIACDEGGLEVCVSVGKGGGGVREGKGRAKRGGDTIGKINSLELICHSKRRQSCSPLG